MAEQRINDPPIGVRRTVGVQPAGSADRRPRRRESDERRNDHETPRKRRHLFDLLFEEIDRVPELGERQRERLKHNIRAHMAMRARDSTPLPTVLRDAAAPTDPASEHDPPEHDLAEKRGGGESAAAADDSDHEPLIHIAAPQTPDLPADELAQNAELARQLRDCLTRNTEATRKVAVYLKILLSIDGALAPHVVVDI